jgi:hypothetical protein
VAVAVVGAVTGGGAPSPGQQVNEEVSTASVHRAWIVGAEPAGQLAQPLVSRSGIRGDGPGPNCPLICVGRVTSRSSAICGTVYLRLPVQLRRRATRSSNRYRFTTIPS